MNKIQVAPRNTPVTHFAKANIFEFEDWMIENTDGSVHAMGSAFALAGIPDDHFIKMSARQQRMMWGSAVLGKKAFALRHGRFEVVWSSGFGGDREMSYLTEYLQK